MSQVLERTVPDAVGSRHFARELFASLERPLTEKVIVVHCGNMRAATPSFADEIILEVLVRSSAAELILKSPPDLMVEYAIRAAMLRGVSDRLAIER